MIISIQDVRILKTPTGWMTGSQNSATPDVLRFSKIYGGYDHTDFSNYEGAERRLFDLNENNFYLNTTFRKRTSGGWNWFAGAAFSFFEQKIGNVSLSADHWMEQQQELHAKAKVFKRISPAFRLDMGVESFIRRYENRYQYQMKEVEGIDSHHEINPTISAGFLSATYYPVEQLKAELSVRTEYTSLNEKVNFSPRLAVNYYLGDVVLSATAGRYTQLPG